VLNQVYRYALLSRPYNSLAPILLLCIGALFSQAPFVELTFAIVVAILIHSATSILNDVEDAPVDKTNLVDSPLQKGSVSLQTAVLVSYGLFLVAIYISIITLPLITSCIFLILIFLGWTYNSKPFQFSRKPIGSIVVLGISYGLIPVIVGLSIGGWVSVWAAIFLTIFLALIRTSLSILKDYKDVVGDSKHNKKTFLLVYGRTAVQRITLVFASIGYIGATLTVGILIRGPINFTVIAFLLSAWLIYERTKFNPRKSYEQLNHQFHRCLALQLIFDGYLIAWLSISLV
jgi:4-hydroxybenzoate polyprenyltransferase